MITADQKYSTPNALLVKKQHGDVYNKYMNTNWHGCLAVDVYPKYTPQSVLRFINIRMSIDVYNKYTSLPHQSTDVYNKYTS